MSLRLRLPPWSSPLGCLLVALLLAAPPARGEDDADTEVAKRLFKQGRDLYMKGDYEKALGAFERARVAKPLPAFDFNIARCHDRLGRWADALAAYERFAATSSDAADAQEAQARIPVLRERLRTSARRAAADEHYRTAVVHFNNNAFLPAAEEFKLAYREVPDPLYLYNVGQAYRLANDPANATRYYQEFVRSAPTSPQRAAVERRIEEIKTGLPSAPTPAPGSSAGAAGTATRFATAGSGSPSERLQPVAELIKSNRPGFRACFDAWSANHPGVGGRVILSFFLDPDGVANEMQAEAQGFDAPEVAACVVEYARKIAFPAASNRKYTRFKYPFDFKPN